LIPVSDISATTKAQAFVQHVVAIFSLPTMVRSDTSLFFTKACSLLGIKHRTSVSMMAKSNGQVEALVKKPSSLLHIYTHDDVAFETQLPFIEISIRASPQARLPLRPYKIVMGRSSNKWPVLDHKSYPT